MSRSLFLTGATGYLGRRLLVSLWPAGFERIVCLVRDPARFEAPDGPTRIDVVEGDLRRPDSYREALEGCEAVLHAGALTGKARREAYFAVNARGTRDLVAAAAEARIERFLFVSSIAVSFPDQTLYHYAHSKRAAEEAVQEGGIPYCIVRPTIIMGPGAPVMEGLEKLAGAAAIPVFGDGKVRVQPIHVDDLARAIAALLEREAFQNDVIELGGPDVVTLEELLQRIRARRFDKAPRSVHLPLAPVRGILGLLEGLLFPVLPLTAGQLATFANDGVAEPSPFLAERVGTMTGLDDTLEAAAAHE